jgi:hypothetical protein
MKPETSLTVSSKRTTIKLFDEAVNHLKAHGIEYVQRDSYFGTKIIKTKLYYCYNNQGQIQRAIKKVQSIFTDSLIFTTGFNQNRASNIYIYKILK